jgi:hypothetical protein
MLLLRLYIRLAYARGRAKVKRFLAMFPIFLAISIPAAADEYQVVIGQFIPMYNIQQTNKLRALHANDFTNFEIGYLNVVDRQFYFGGGFSHFDLDYQQSVTSERPEAIIQSDTKYLYGVAGIKIGRKKFSITPQVRAGLEHNDVNNLTVKGLGTYRRDYPRFDIGAVGAFDLGIYENYKITFQHGSFYSYKPLNKIEYGGITYLPEEFRNHDLQMTFGLGIKF